MKRSQPEPETSHPCKKLFSVAQEPNDFEDFSELDAELDEDYPESDLESVSVDDLDLDFSDSEGSRSSDEKEFSSSGDTRSRPRTKVDPRWSKNYTPVDNSFDDSHCGPRNIPPHINEYSRALDFVHLFLDQAFWQNITDMTNLRAQQAKEETPTKYYCKNFKELTMEEMKAFLGLRLQMETTVMKPQLHEYWLSEGKNFISHTPGFKDVMCGDRFFAIWAYLHVVNENDESVDKTDKIYKVRPVLTTFLEKFRHLYLPKQFLTLDEGMIPTKNRLSIKQYIKDKPVKFGIKTFILCEGDTGYIVSSEVYTGKSKFEVNELGATGNVVLRLLLDSDASNKKHILVMDRYYNSVTLTNYLHKHERTLTVGTALTNRKLYPKELHKKKMLNRGDYDYLCQENIVCMMWKDRKPINFISSCYDPKSTVTANRRNKDGSVVEITMPMLVKQYTMYMGGTDKNDQLTRLRKTRRHYRWPRRLLVKFIMWAIYNAYVIFQALYPQKAKHYSFKEFLDQYCLELVGSFRISAVSRETKQCNTPARLQNVSLHHPEIPADGSTNHLCVVCSYKYNNFKKKNPDVAYKDYPVKAVKSAIRCTKCKSYICVKRGSTCWADWHSKVEYWH